MQEDNIYKNGSMKNETPLGVPARGDGNPPLNPRGKRGEKPRTRFGILTLAARLFQPSAKSGEKKPKETTEAPAQWEKIVGSMRPLHLQENLQSPTASPVATDFISTSAASSPSPSFYSKRSDNGTMSQYDSAANLEDLDQASSQHGSSQYGSVGNLQELDTMSNYSSVSNLQGLVESDEEKDPYEENGDDMIDLKAEEFIALFYQKMRLEQANRHHNNGGRQWVL